MPYELPPLPYDYNALEPHIDERTVRIHHDLHHAGYVKGFNNAEEKLAAARQAGDFGLVKHWARELAFHGSGHILHTLYWENMGPNGGGQPGGALAEQIARDFGSFETFKKQFTAATNAVEASGWGLLVWNPMFGGKLEVLQTEKHQDLAQWGVVPLLVCDVWEHAYYLKYQNKRPDYVEAWWNVVNWTDVAKRFDAARK